MIYNNISDSAKIGNNVKFGQFITVGDNVEIGDNCIIESYSCIGYSNGRERSGLSIGQNRDRRRVVAKMATLVQFGQCRLYRAVTAIDDQHFRFHPGNGFQRLGNFINMIHFIVENIAVFDAIRAHFWQNCPVPGRVRIGKKCDICHELAPNYPASPVHHIYFIVMRMDLTSLPIANLVFL